MEGRRVFIPETNSFGYEYEMNVKIELKDIRNKKILENLLRISEHDEDYESCILIKKRIESL